VSSVLKKSEQLSADRRVKSVIDLIGNTPLIRLNKITEGLSPNVKV